jgi:hypothetical protein
VEELLALRGSASESAISAERFGDEEAIIGKSRNFVVSLEPLFCSLPAPSRHSRFSRKLSNLSPSHLLLLKQAFPTCPSLTVFFHAPSFTSART